MRIGIGYDSHKLKVGRPLILGGVKVPHTRGFEAHSDGDVLTHAIIDAILGAAALGNIGLLFPDKDPTYKNANSIDLLKQVMEKLKASGASLVNVDAVIIAEKPLLNPHLDDIRASLASALGVDVGAVSVKPKTNEGMGPEGREECISVQAVALIQ